MTKTTKEELIELIQTTELSDDLLQKIMDIIGSREQNHASDNIEEQPQETFDELMHIAIDGGKKVKSSISQLADQAEQIGFSVKEKVANSKTFDKITTRLKSFANNFAAQIAETDTDECLSHPFSVARGKQVLFAEGNLHYTPAEHQLYFAGEQYDTCENANLNMSEYKQYQEETDLFPFSITTRQITEESPWRVLTEEEWKYLFIGRERYGKSFKCTIITDDGDVRGVVLLPDDWELARWKKFNEWTPDTSSTACNKCYLTLDEWDALEDFGAVFLPETNWEACNAGATLKKGNAIAYWTASKESAALELEGLRNALPQIRQARALYISTEYSGAAMPEYICDWMENKGLLAVRLVKDIKE